MANNQIDNTRISDYTNTFTDYSVDGQTTDAATGEYETEYQITKASEYLGYYKTIPELKIAIDVKGRWTIGKGYEADTFDMIVLDKIKGFGKDTFNSILENMVREYHIYGDAFAEIIFNEDGDFVNLKPLDPGSIKIVASNKGIIKRYEQVSKSDKAKTKKFSPKQIFHLCKDRVADEIHGVSVIDAVENIILMRHEAINDYRKLLHRNIYPVRIWKLDTDIPSQINTFKAKVASTKSEGEDIFIPKGTVEIETASMSGNNTMNPLPWINMLNQYFYQAVGVPQIVIGGAQELTQTGAQIAYLSFEQTVEEEQLYIETQVFNQLGIEINLEFPASLQSNALNDNRKDSTQQNQLNQASTIQPSMLRSAEGGQ